MQFCYLVVNNVFAMNVCSFRSETFSTSWQGRLFVSDANKSEIGQKIELKVKGEYAIKVR